MAPYHGWWWSRFYGERRAGTHCWLLGPGNGEARWGCLSTTPPRLVVLLVIRYLFSPTKGLGQVLIITLPRALCPLSPSD